MTKLSQYQITYIPQTRSRDDSSHRMVKRKTIQNNSMRNYNVSRSLFRDPLLKQLKYPYNKFLEMYLIWRWILDTDYQENSPYQESTISETYQKTLIQVILPGTTRIETV